MKIFILLNLIALVLGAPTEQCAILKIIYEKFGYATTTIDDNCCESSISCDEAGFITKVDIQNYRENNVVPFEIGQLKNLKSLYIEGQTFSGGLPEEIADLVNLEELTLANMTDAIVPPVIAKFLNLKRLILRDSRFTGEIPAFIGTLTKLEALDLARNRFTGQIPSEMAQLKNLNFLYLQDNKLTGTFPINAQFLLRICMVPRTICANDPNTVPVTCVKQSKSYTLGYMTWTASEGYLP